MAGQSKGIIAVVAAGVLLGAGLAVAYFTVLTPRTERRRAQKEVDAWGERWKEARACLVGEEPRSKDGYEAMLLREALEPGRDLETSLASCLESLKRLRRDSEYTSGDDAIEDAWSALSEEVKHLAKAHAWRTAKEKPRPLAQLRTSLAQAIPFVDGAYAELREAAGMEADPPPGEDILPQAPEAAAAVPARTVNLRGDVVVVWRHERGTRWLQRRAGPGEADKKPAGPGVVVNAGDATWGLWAERGGIPDDGSIPPEEPAVLRAGPLDDLGDPAAEGAEIARLPEPEAQVAPIFALGDGDRRVALYVVRDTASRQRYLARSEDGGETWDQVLEVAPAADATVDYGRRRIDLYWPDGGGLSWLPISESTLDEPVRPRRLLPAGEVDTPRVRSACFGAESAWWQIGGALYFARPGAERAQPVPGSGSITGTLRCNDRRLLSISAIGNLRRPVALELVLCRPEGCEDATRVPLADGSAWAATLDAESAPALAILTGGILALWTGDPESDEALSPRVTLRAPDAWELRGLVEWGGRLHAVVLDGDTTRIVPLEDA